MTLTPRFKRNSPLWLVLESFLLLFLWGCAQSPQSVRTTSLPVSHVEPQGPAAEWRAINRLSYGPTPTLMADIKSKAHPKEWALNQLDAARKASLPDACIGGFYSSVRRFITRFSYPAIGI